MIGILLCFYSLSDVYFLIFVSLFPDNEQKQILFPLKLGRVLTRKKILGLNLYLELFTENIVFISNRVLCVPFYICFQPLMDVHILPNVVILHL